ncbi:uncharacterized protein CDAR_99991 [Caerostris darwini]|uniref:Uncharacterized protein n=1 Tax=Caerostris darwini TaxID=1538125 RepID=A0AAV4RGX6_9ARAC|nr:uncharacterized protein CDAR_99991 [Caerostris darwini]
MWLTPSVSVVLLLRAINCEISADDASTRTKKFLIDVGESSSNTISKPTSDRPFINNTANSKASEEETFPNFLQNGFHGYISSDESLTNGYGNPPKETSYQDSTKNIQPSKQKFYNFFSKKSYYPPENKLPLITSGYQSFKSSAQSNLYPELQDRLPPLQLLQFKDSNRRSKIDSKYQNQTMKNESSRFARFLNARQSGEDSMWNWLHQDEESHHHDGMTPFNMMSMMMDRMDPPSKDDGDLATLLKSHVPVMVAAGVIPLSLMLFAVLPIIIKNHIPQKENKPAVSTTATGNSKTISNSSQFLDPFLDAISSPRSEDSDCFMKTFCKIAKQEKDIWPWQDTIDHISAFMDESILDSFGMKPFVEVLKDGKCEEIDCSKGQISLRDFSANAKSFRKEP